MYKWMTVMIVSLALGVIPAGAKAAPETMNEYESLLEDKDEVLKTEMEAAETGDEKEFSVSTDDDIRSLEAGDIYKSNNSFFKVTRIGSQGADGGKFTVQRIAGKNDPSRKWNRISGLGPLTVVGRETLLDRFLSGGRLMYPIAFLLLVLIVILLNSLWVYRRGKQCPVSFVGAAKDSLTKGDVERFEGLAQGQSGLFASICRAMVTNFRTSTDEDIRARCESEAIRQISLLRTPLKGLNFIAAVAPLLGLLGTVIGMIACFDSLSGEMASASKSQAMAGGIKVALLTTAAGLSVAVPALLVFFIFNQKLNLIVAHCEALAGDFVHELVTIKRRISGGPEVAGGDEGDAKEQQP